MKLYYFAGLLFVPGAALAQDADGDGIANNADFFPCDAARASVSYFPGQSSSALLTFEDQWPASTDLDFNDVAVRVHYRLERNANGEVVTLHGVYDATALGGEYSNGLGLQLPVNRAGVTARRRIGGGAWETVSLEGDTYATMVLSPNLRELFGNQQGILNSRPELAVVSGQRLELEVTFATPAALSIHGAPFDVFIFRVGSSPRHEIHFPQYAGTAQMNGALFNTGEDGSTATRRFVHFSGVPAALNLMTTSYYPSEGNRISNLFPNINTFASSGGVSNPDFYLVNVATAQGRSLTAASVPAMTAPSQTCLSGGAGSLTLASFGASSGYGNAVDVSRRASNCYSGSVVGAPIANVGTIQGGAVVVLNEAGTTLETVLVANDAARGDIFGSAVVYGDRIVVVGAPGANIYGSYSGAAYVFIRESPGMNLNTGTWRQAAKLVPSSGAAGARFGNSVGISGDGATIAVGAPGENGGAGAVYVFQLVGRDRAWESTSRGFQWNQAARLVAADGHANQGFGTAVALPRSNLVASTLVVGAPQDNGRATQAGAAYIFERTSGIWGAPTKLTASDASASARFGYSVATDDGLVAIGAPFDNNRGAAYAYTLSSGIWTQRQKLVSPSPAANENFGLAVGVGAFNIGVGAPGRNYGEGGAYMFPYQSSTISWLTPTVTTGSGTVPGHGQAVALSSGRMMVGSVGAISSTLVNGLSINSCIHPAAVATLTASPSTVVLDPVSSTGRVSLQWTSERVPGAYIRASRNGSMVYQTTVSGTGTREMLIGPGGPFDYNSGTLVFSFHSIENVNVALSSVTVTITR